LAWARSLSYFANSKNLPLIGVHPDQKWQKVCTVVAHVYTFLPLFLIIYINYLFFKRPVRKRRRACSQGTQGTHPSPLQGDFNIFASASWLSLFIDLPVNGQKGPFSDNSERSPFFYKITISDKNGLIYLFLHLDTFLFICRKVLSSCTLPGGSANIHFSYSPYMSRREKGFSYFRITSGSGV
jgi:hypothetical protein